jgi:hypothetical protein
MRISERIGLAMLVVAVGCQSGLTDFGETDGETEGTGSSTGDGATSSASASASATTPSTMTAMSMSGSGDEDSGDPPDPDSTGSTSSDDASDEPPCPPGELGCPCDVGASCVDDLMCEGGECVDVPACAQPEGEPNDDEGSAVDLGALMCGGADVVADGALDGAETDWFLVDPQPGIVCLSSPSATVAASDGSDLTVCMYAHCTMGTSNASCGFAPGSGTPDTSPDGDDGCCNTGSVDVSNVFCNAIDQSWVARVRVTGDGAACLDYELTLSY